MSVVEIGRIITQRREQLSLNQEDLAEMAQVAIKTVYMVESGKGNPSLRTLEKIMSILGLELIARIRQIDETMSLQ